VLKVELPHSKPKCDFSTNLASGKLRENFQFRTDWIQHEIWILEYILFANIWKNVLYRGRVMIQSSDVNKATS